MIIITWLIDNKHCKNVPHAEATIALLNLGELYAAKDDAGIIARVELYKAWKKSGMYKKSDRAACAMKAIAGEPVPEPAALLDSRCPECKGRGGFNNAGGATTCNACEGTGIESLDTEPER